MESRQYNAEYLNKTNINETIEKLAKELRKKKKEDCISKKRIISTPSLEPHQERLSLLATLVNTSVTDPLQLSIIFANKLIKNELSPTKDIQFAIMWHVAGNLMNKGCGDLHFNKALTDIGIIDYIAKTIYTEDHEYEKYCLTIVNNLCTAYTKACKATIESELLPSLVSHLSPPFNSNSYIYYQIIGNIAGNGKEERDRMLQLDVVDLMKSTLFQKDLDVLLVRAITFCMCNILIFKPYPPDKQIRDIVQYSCRTVLANDDEIICNSLVIFCYISEIGKAFLGDILSNGIMQRIVALFESASEQISRKAIEVVHNVCSYTSSEVKVCLESDALSKLLKILMSASNEENRRLIIAAIGYITVEGDFSEFIYSQNTYDVLVKQFKCSAPNSFKDNIILAICNGMLVSNADIFSKICTGDCIDCIIESLNTNAMDSKKTQTLLQCIKRITIECEDENVKLAFKAKKGYEAISRYQFFPDINVFNVAKEILDKENSESTGPKSLL